MVPISVEIYSDTVCPFCYLGKKKLDQAIKDYQAKHPDTEFKLIWKPYFLHPEADVSAYGKRDFYTAKLGDRAPAFFSRVEQACARMDVPLRWDGCIGNSRDSHKLILLAMDKDHLASLSTPSATSKTNRQNNFLSAMFQGAFEHGDDISDREFLIRTAVDAGVAADASEARAWLDADAPGVLVDAEDKRAKAIGIGAVPTYVVGGRLRVGGMQEPQVFVKLFDKLREVGELGEGRGVLKAEAKREAVIAETKED